MKSQHILQAQLKTARANARPKFLIEFAKPAKRKIVIKKSPTLQKKLKTPRFPSRYLIMIFYGAAPQLSEVINLKSNDKNHLKDAKGKKGQHCYVTVSTVYMLN